MSACTDQFDLFSLHCVISEQTEHCQNICLPFSPPGFEFFEASAKDNINVKQTFERLVDIICEKMSESLDAGDPAVTGAKQGPQLTEQPAPPHQDCAC